MIYLGKKLGDVRWSHAVNSTQKLEQVISDDTTDVIESDILRGENSEVICAHPPQTTSDLLVSRLFQVISHSGKGLKLDFKQSDVVTQVLEELKQSSIDPKRVILNADVLQGNNAALSKFEPDIFIQQARAAFPHSLLSLGWTTTTEDVYTEAQVDEMLSYVDGLEHVAFPIRVCLIEGSWNALSRLLDANPTYSLSLWNNEPIEASTVAWVKKNTDPAKTFYDFIDEGKESVSIL